MTTAADRPAGVAHRARRGRRWVGRVGWPVLAVLGVLVLVWTLRFGESTFVVVVATSALGLLLLLAWPILVAALVSRHHRLAVAAAAVVAAQALIAAPLLPTAGLAADVAAGEPVYSLTSANLSVANPDPAAAGRAIMQEPADIFVVEEYSPSAEAALEEAGVLDRYSAGHHDQGTLGDGVYARHPVETELAVVARRPLRVDTVALPGGQTLRIVVVHVPPPRPGLNAGPWRQALLGLDRQLAALEEPWIAVGDFNATPFHRAYRDLLHDGRTDAHLATGRGLARTWPADLGLLRPFAAIDHALLSPGVDAIATREVDIPGSDHRAIHVEFTVG